MPAYNNPTSPAISQNCNSAILYQFFYYYSQIDDEDQKCDYDYVIYFFHGGDDPKEGEKYFRGIEFKGELVILVTQSNGDLVDKMVIEFFKSTGKSRSESIPILLSPNGRYVAFPINPAYVPGSDSLAKNYNQI